MKKESIKKIKMVNKTYNAADLDAFMKIAASWQNNTLAEDFGGKNNDMQNYLNPAMNLYKKRERTQNWNHQEKKFLLELCRKDMRIIENKRLDAGLTAVKNKAWKIIHQKFSEAFGTDRTCNRLKEQWRRMKACTRNEILDYNNRVGRYGQEAADRKKPSPFTFEIWDFMQEAKRQCKSEALDGVDYSKVPLALEEDFEFNESAVNDDNESDVKPSHHDLCDVRIKEEDADSDENDNNNDRRSGSVDCISSPNDDSNIASSSDLPNNISNNNFTPDTSTLSTSFNINNIAATLETLNALRNNFTINNSNNNNNNNNGNNQQNGANNNNNNNNNDQQLPPAKRQRRTSSSNSSTLQQQQQQQIQSTLGSLNGSTSTVPSTELKIFMEMQAKEHLLRMQILETQLQTAKYNRDIVEINKTIALQKLHDIANRRMS